MKKAREWWINADNNFSNVCLIAEPGETRQWAGVHVIEKNAFDELLAEAMKLREACILHGANTRDKDVEAFDKFLIGTE